MFEILFRLVLAICLLVISLSGFTFAAAMWRRSNQQVCAECKEELNK